MGDKMFGSIDAIVGGVAPGAQAEIDVASFSRKVIVQVRGKLGSMRISLSRDSAIALAHQLMERTRA